MEAPREAVEFIRKRRKFIVLGHREPDGDCVASQLAMSGLLASLGKEASRVSVGPFDRPEIASFGGMFAPAVEDRDLQGDPGVVILDCSTADRTGSPGARIAGLPCLVVDHHSSGEAFGDVRFVEVTAPSTTVLVLALFDAFGVVPTTEQARLLLFGLCTDTGFFRHLGAGSADSFRTIARLVDCGTSTAEVFQMVFGKRDLASRKLLATMLQRTESYWGGQVLLTWQVRRDREEAGTYLRGEDELYRLLQTVRGNHVVIFIKEEDDGLFSIGFRSNHSLDVGAIAQRFGGGGHRQAAGCDMRGTLESVKRTMIDTFSELFRA
jgi:phosphoesterase RecJ-like protein